ncbi:uncharacterized protein LOC9307998 isoform X2 [Arabidopsis lyrata subsp. lyrata]|uniref:uncharacterized protein LOC9307998 isoform X2 n=1 Tax=Arabidopsis lyrata subsp. lyrata TaxID=81972 RepID=UPI000A29AA19|nr:uncharacterized protein LOC9307998 isoform X2 [Arabidopsis lyrata subsp. lyrata]|eukprot:XP_020876168.1 uncharacterized protein LOC9307998 isoform X2 [Arabidopsis lyrata subsp. lyrata]
MVQFHLPDKTSDRLVMIPQRNSLVLISSPGSYLVIRANQGHGLVLTVSTFESFHVQLVEEEVILHAQIAESRGRDWTALNAKERCLGDCVIWEESIDERPWEKARSSSPFRVKEDDEVDNLEIKFSKRRKSKRIYQSPTPEVGQKISRSLKSLNAKTGLFSKRMKIIHRDPVLHAQRVAAIKKAKGTPAARKHASESMKAFFSDPDNREQRSLSMKGVKFYCKNCGQEGHRRHYCPELGTNADRRFRCRGCGGKGHNRRTCPKSKSMVTKGISTRHHQCGICGESGHNSRTCLKPTGVRPSGPGGDSSGDGVGRRRYACRFCNKMGHNVRTCPSKQVSDSDSCLEQEGS